MARFVILLGGMGLLLPGAAASPPVPPPAFQARGLLHVLRSTDERTVEKPGPFLTTKTSSTPGMARSLHRLSTDFAGSTNISLPAQFPDVRPARSRTSTKPLGQLRQRVTEILKGDPAPERPIPPAAASAPIGAPPAPLPLSALASVTVPEVKRADRATPSATGPRRDPIAQAIGPEKPKKPIDRAALTFENADEVAPQAIELPPLMMEAAPTSPPACVALASDHRTWYWSTAKTRFCQSPLGRLTRLALTPVRLGTGLPQCCCDVPGPALLGRMARENASVPEMTAAKIKIDEAGAGARLDAVRYLATVDCHYFPEAEEALLAALRCDRNEWVRQEAARALGNGRCVSRRVIETLQVVVSATDDDHNPAESSDRVRAVAFVSLQNCLAQGNRIAISPVPAEPPATQLSASPPPAADVVSKLQQIRYNAPSPKAPQHTSDAIAAAWRLLAENVSTAPPPSPAASRANRTEHPSSRPVSSHSITESMGLTPIGRLPQ